MNIAFIDCETTHLDAELGEAWEVAVILREHDGAGTTDTEYAWQIRPNLATASKEALEVGRYLERFAVPVYAEAAFTAHESGHITPMTRAEAVTAIANVLSGAVIVGSNPGFDDRFLRKLVGHGNAQWHYRPYDIVQLAAAKLGVQAAGPLPWPTHPMSRAVGVEPPSKDVAHTALGDARWARDVHDAAMVREQIPLTWEGRAQHAISLYTQTAIELEDAERERDRLRQVLHLLRSGLAHAQSAAYVVKLAKQAEAAVAQAPGTDGQPSDAAALWPSAVLSALDGPSRPVMTGNHHYGRRWAGHDIEDACPCTKAPCGLVAQAAAECTQHRADKSMRQSHPVDTCPGSAVPGVVRRRKRPVDVDTIQWTGDNEAAVQAFAGSGNFHTVDEDDRIEDPDITAEVWDTLHCTWVGTKTGQHVVRGVKGEYYPIDEDVLLAETYDPGTPS